MAKWSREKVNSENINGGNQYERKDRVSLEQLNAMVNSGLYSQDFAEHLADAPDISQANTVGAAKVEFVDNVVGGKTYKKFKFSNLKGNKGDKGDKGDKGNTGAIPVITATATTLPAGSSATVTKSGTAENPTLAFGIPKGDKGDTGASAGFGTPTATIDSNVGTPSVTVTASGSDTSKVFNFAFKNLKGEKGDKGDTGTTGATGATGATPNISVSATTLSAGSSATATISGSAESPTINFGIPKGDKGESGEIYQSTGTSTSGAMSQKATTDELAKKAGKDSQNIFTTLNTFKQGFYIKNDAPSGIYTSFYPHTEGTMSIELRKEENGTDSPLCSFSFGEGGLYFRATDAANSSPFVTYKTLIKHLMSTVYPVGSIYMSTVNKSPASFLGGKWTQILGKFLLSSDDFLNDDGVITTNGSYHVGDTGGEATHTLTTSEMPSHRHSLYSSSGYSGDSIGLGNNNGKYLACTLNAGNVGYYDTTKTGSACLSNTGDGTAHNNMPPYYTVYMWERVPDDTVIV